MNIVESHFENSEKYASLFEQNVPIKHLVIENFLEKHEELLETVRNLEFKEKNSDLFDIFQTDDLSNTNNKILLEFLSLINSSKAKNFIFEISGKKITNADFHATKYVKTHYLLPHDDQLEGRKIAYLYYCSTLEKEDGGALELFSVNDEKRPVEVVKSIQPKENTLVLFEVSDESFHQVSEVVKDIERFTIGGWFYA